MTRRSATPTAQRGGVCIGVGAFRPKFYGNGVILYKNVDTVR